VLALALVAPLAAQSPSQPRLFLSAFAGYRAGHTLWTLNDQPFAVFVTSGDTAVANGAGQYDTLNLTRRLVPGLVGGGSASYFPKPNVGVEAELAFLGMSLESQCAIRQSQPPVPNDVDPELCASLQGQSVATNAVSLSVGLVGRLSPGGNASPYVRLDAGLLTRARGTIAMSGTFTSANGNIATATVVADPNPRTTDVHLTLGAGVAFGLGPGYRVRFEGRDAMARLDQVTGPADPNSPTTGSLAPPHGARLSHNFVFIVALDVIFEKRRGRRY
jgi:hypothetical protein